MLVEVPAAVTSPSRPGQLGNVLCGFRVLGVKWGSFDSSRVKQFGKDPRSRKGGSGSSRTDDCPNERSPRFTPNNPTTKHSFDVCVYLESQSESSSEGTLLKLFLPF